MPVLRASSVLLGITLFSPSGEGAEASWNVETVTTFGNHVDIAVTPAGTPHLVFTDCTHWEICAVDPSEKSVWHGTRTSSAWSFDQIATSPAGVYTDIVLDSSDVPHVVWVAEAGDQVYYSVDTGAGWVSEPLHHEVVNGYRHTPVLVLDAAGEPHVVYNQSETMRHAHRVAGVWNEERIPGSSQDNWSARGVPRFTSDGTLLVGTWRYYESAVLFRKDGETWTVDPVGGDAGWHPWMEIDAFDRVHMTYFGHSGFRYATNSSGSWVEEPIDEAAGLDSNDFVLDGEGRPQVVYVRPTLVSISPILYDVELIFAYRAGPGPWATQVIDSARSQAEFQWNPRIARDAAGTLHVVYRYGDAEELRYATHPAPTAVPPAVRPEAAIVSVAPNPFNPSTKIEIRIETRGNVDLGIYDLSGRLVRQLYSGEAGPPTLVRHWDGLSRRGERVASGVYVVRLGAGGTVDSRRLVLVK